MNNNNNSILKFNLNCQINILGKNNNIYGNWRYVFEGKLLPVSHNNTQHFHGGLILIAWLRRKIWSCKYFPNSPTLILVCNCEFQEYIRASYTSISGMFNFTYCRIKNPSAYIFPREGCILLSSSVLLEAPLNEIGRTVQAVGHKTRQRKLRFKGNCD